MLKTIVLLCTLLSLSYANLSLDEMKKEKRVAMIIVNEHYPHIHIKGLALEAEKMKQFLQKRGFKVFYAYDLKRSALIKTFRNFTNEISSGSVALLYFNGMTHQFKGKNFFLSSEVSITDDNELQDKAIDINKIILKMIRQDARLNFLIIDGAKEKKYYGKFKTTKKGLAPLKLPSKWHLMLSSRPNVCNTNKYFTRSFIKTYSQKGLSVKEGKAKLPYIRLAKGNSFYFSLPNKILSPELKAFENAKRINSIASFSQFTKSFAHSKYITEVKKRVAIIKKQSQAKNQQVIKDKEAHNQKMQKQQAQNQKEKLKIIRKVLREKGVRTYEPEMVDIPLGSFIMGGPSADSSPRKEIKFKTKIRMAKYEVTNKEYTQYLKFIGKSTYKPSALSDKDQPASDISWYAANNYAKWLSKYTGKKYRLPTEAEWEYCARAETTGKYMWGAEKVDVIKYAWMKRNAHDITHEYGLIHSNQWGLFDVFGNVSEWCLDDYKTTHNHLSSKGNAYINAELTHKVIRGGNYKSTTQELSSALRYHNVPDFYDHTTGFRLVLEVQ